MEAATIAELKANLASFLKRVVDGEEFTITKHGRPIALLTKAPSERERPKLGTLSGRIHFTPGWDAPMTEEELKEFIGDSR